MILIRTVTRKVLVQVRFCSSNVKPYPDFLDTTTMQKAILALGSSVMALSNPYRADMVAVNGEVTGLLALKRLHAKMKANPEGRMILKDRPVINTKTVDFKYLKGLPDNTLGFHYANYSEVYNISPDSRDKVQYVNDPELAYIMQRYRETHDIVHAILDMPTNMVGEVAVKWVEALQTGFPMCVGGALLGPVRFTPRQVRQFQALRPWAIKTGIEAKTFINIYYEKRWEQDLEQFREEMNFDTFDN